MGRLVGWLVFFFDQQQKRKNFNMLYQIILNSRVTSIISHNSNEYTEQCMIWINRCAKLNGIHTCQRKKNARIKIHCYIDCNPFSIRIHNTNTRVNLNGLHRILSSNIMLVLLNRKQKI